MQKDSVLKTVAVAAILCIACSVLVSGSVVALKDRQDANIELDIKKNLLIASGLLKGKSFSKEQIESAYSKIEAVVIDLETGAETDIDPQSFDQKKASKDPEKGKLIDADKDVAGIKRRSKFAPAYKYMENGMMKMLILPVNGKGLWSTLYGFLALSSDLQTVEGIGFYQHGETPGLGGEIDNPGWKAKWAGKKIYDDAFEEVELKVIKGVASADSTYEIDGLSGATITSNGVTGLVKYWMGDDGFGPYLAQLRTGGNAPGAHDHDSHHQEADHSHKDHHDHNHGKHHGEKEHKHDDHDDHHNDQEHAHEDHHDHDHSEHHEKEGE